MAADFSGNGKLDLAVAYSVQETGPSGFVLLPGNGDGTFQSPVVYQALARPEMDGGRRSQPGWPPDLLLGRPGTGGGAIFLNNGGGGFGDAQFAPPVWYAGAEGVEPVNVVLADLRKNGLADMVAGEGSATSVLLNEGHATFVDGEGAASVPGAYDCAVGADFSGDGKPDLAVPTPQGITIFLGPGKAEAPYAIGPSFAVSGLPHHWRSERGWNSGPAAGG